jgi:hypothetical protein
VRRHDHADAVLDCSRKWLQLAVSENVKRSIDDRKFTVGVNLGVAVAGEVLAARSHAIRFHLCEEGERRLGHRLGSVSVGSGCDDRIVWVAVDVQHEPCDWEWRAANTTIFMINRYKQPLATCRLSDHRNETGVAGESHSS